MYFGVGGKNDHWSVGTGLLFVYRFENNNQVVLIQNGNIGSFVQQIFSEQHWCWAWVWASGCLS